MNILFVSARPPFPPSDGSRLVVAELARSLSREHTLYFAGLTDAAEPAPELREYFEIVKLVPEPMLPRWRRWWISVFDPLPLWVRLSESAELRNVVRELAATLAIDVVHLDMVRMASYADVMSHLPIVMAPHDSLTLLVEQRMKQAPTRWARTAARLQFEKIKRYEQTRYAAAQRVVVVTEREKNYLQSFAPSLSLRVVANGVDPNFFAPMETKPARHTIGFHGVMDYPENEAAVLDFFKNVLPRIQQQIPDVKFTIIGRNPTDTIRALAEKGRVQVTGTVDDVRPWLASQEMLVVPMLTAGGIKNKLLEAMAMGKPIVATPEAADGIDAHDGSEFLLARGADAFAAACVRVLCDADERARLGANARAWALEHSWSRAANQYLAVYREAIDAAAVR